MSAHIVLKCETCTGPPVLCSRFCCNCLADQGRKAVKAAIGTSLTATPAPWYRRVEIPNPLRTSAFAPERKTVIACVSCEYQHQAIPEFEGELLPACICRRSCSAADRYWASRPSDECACYMAVRSLLINGADKEMAREIVSWLSHQVMEMRDGPAEVKVHDDVQRVVWDAFASAPDHARRMATAMASIEAAKGTFAPAPGEGHVASRHIPEVSEPQWEEKQRKAAEELPAIIASVEEESKIRQARAEEEYKNAQPNITIPVPEVAKNEQPELVAEPAEPEPDAIDAAFADLELGEFVEVEAAPVNKRRSKVARRPSVDVA